MTNEVLIIETLKKAGRPLKPAEIAKLSGIGSGTVRTTIRKMLLQKDVYQPYPQHYSVGERVGDSPSINTSQGIEPHALGNTGLTLESQMGKNASDKITTLYELVYSLIPMNEMKDALERGDEVKTPFQFIFERDFEGTHTRSSL